MADETPHSAPTVAPPPSSQPLPPQTAGTQDPPAPESAAESLAETQKEEPPALEEVEKEDPPPKLAEKAEQSPVVVEEVAVAVVEKEETKEEEEAEVKGKLEQFFAHESEKSNPLASDDREPKIPQSLISFKEESNKVADLSDSERKALQGLRQLIQEALDSNVFSSGQETQAAPSKPGSDTKTGENPEKETKEVAEEAPKAGAGAASVEELSIWGIPLLKDDRTDVILLKFLRARDFKVKDAFAMFRNTIRWRKDFGIEALLDEDLGDELDKVVFMHGTDIDGHPVCYNVFGEFQNKELYQKTFSDQEKRTKFLRYRIQFLERSIRKLDFSPGGISTIFQINDLKNAPGPGKSELRLATKQALHLLQDNYPEFVAKQVFINVPWWHLAFYTVISPFLTQRTKSKFVFAGPAKSPDTLFKYISPEQVPIQYGGLSVDFCDCNPEFSISDPVTEVFIKPGTKQTVEIIIYEKCFIVWELRVVGWEVGYGAEFVPNTQDAYTIIIHKSRKMAPSDEPVVHNSFRVGELGKILLTVDNPTSKKKRLLYRFNIKPLSD
ncbi:Cellular retinaldehyde binding/alpha-tocopherol transport [Parasponia andersonii]|uniref:Cellular retinaldehyde binding/alpha-tocopherol transport n=1 Tax=Parasponia andersonii TaxID=3476 RepID=A0A2P5E1J2_PARAD|nr:Cellular retinaldehyde binding/alpha-tocopherol transport [Parasponia andersonii]